MPRTFTIESPLLHLIRDQEGLTYRRINKDSGPPMPHFMCAKFLRAFFCAELPLTIKVIVTNEPEPDMSVPIHIQKKRTGVIGWRPPEWAGKKVFSELHTDMSMWLLAEEGLSDMHLKEMRELSLLVLGWPCTGEYEELLLPREEPEFDHLLAKT